MDSNSIIEAALFPIPNLVAFPGTIVPLHVFEPRYRQMIHDCVEHDRMVAITHTQKTIHEPAPKDTVEEALNSNQATYKPCDVFSAGHCEILKTLDDGRLLTQIVVSERLAQIEEQQSIPYRIAKCLRYEDTHHEDAECRRMQWEINNLMMQLVGEEMPQVKQALATPAWTELSPSEYSFRIFQFLRADAEIMQYILEAQSPQNRLQTIASLLRTA